MVTPQNSIVIARHTCLPFVITFPWGIVATHGAYFNIHLEDKSTAIHLIQAAETLASHCSATVCVERTPPPHLKHGSVILRWIWANFKRGELSVLNFRGVRL